MDRCYMACLGTSPYVECTYVAPDGRQSREVRFVQEATVRLFCQDWGPADRILIFTTEEAHRKNWQDNGHGDGKLGLHRRLKAAGFSSEIRQVYIPEGKTIEEIWQIFQILYDQLQEGDRIICDITHGFRSLPMLVLAVLGYARTMKQIIPEGIYYGAFEVLGPPAQVKEMLLEKRRAPIFNLTPFAALLDWTAAIDRFLVAGDAILAQDLATKEIHPLLRDSRGQDRAAQAIRRVAESLKKLTEAVSTCRGPELPGILTGLRQALADCPQPDLIPPFAPLIQRVADKLQEFSTQSPLPALVAARWCAEHNLIQQGYTILQEGLITHLVETVLHGDAQKLKKRDLINQSAKIYKNKLEEKHWHEPARSHPQHIASLIAFWEAYPDLLNVFGELTQARNDLNHAAFRGSPMPADSFAPKLHKLLQRVETILGG